MLGSFNDVIEYRSSRRIDKSGISEHVGPNARFQGVLGYKVDFPPKKPLKVQHQPGMLHQAYFRLWQKLNKKIDIAVWAHLTPRGRSKQRELSNLLSPTEVRQLGLINHYIAEMEYLNHGSSLSLCPELRG